MPTSFDTPARLFQLPYDIRSIILMMAFGERTFHVDIFREEEEQAWQWRGAICRRNYSTLQWNMLRLPSMRNVRYAWVGPWNDPCLQGVYGRQCKGKFPEEYHVGIIGFLLSCRQAYTEGVDILYSANCINIQSEPLLLHLPQLILPNRLASITSLEIVITAHYIKQDNDRPSFNLPHLKPILDNIVTHCHHLRILWLAFMGNETLTALPLVDAFYRSKRLRNMRVELPARVYWLACNFESKNNYAHPREAPARGPLEKSPWRSLDNEEPIVQIRSMERYPYPPLKLPVLDEDESVESAGYWLTEGYELMQPLVCIAI
jgi:hypothetical protein